MARQQLSAPAPCWVPRSVSLGPPWGPPSTSQCHQHLLLTPPAAQPALRGQEYSLPSLWLSLFELYTWKTQEESLVKTLVQPAQLVSPQGESCQDPNTTRTFCTQSLGWPSSGALLKHPPGQLLK